MVICIHIHNMSAYLANKFDQKCFSTCSFLSHPKLRHYGLLCNTHRVRWVESVYSNGCNWHKTALTRNKLDWSHVIYESASQYRIATVLDSNISIKLLMNPWSTQSVAGVSKLCDRSSNCYDIRVCEWRPIYSTIHDESCQNSGKLTITRFFYSCILGRIHSNVLLL